MNKVKRMTRGLRVGSDIDEVLADFMGAYLKRFGAPKNDLEITKNVYKLRNDKQFWETLPVLQKMNFIPALYCTKRISSKTWTKNWMAANSIPNRPIYQRHYQRAAKSTLIKGRCDVFIDDSISNFHEINSAGIPCLLMDTPHNRHFETKYRIYTMDINEIKTKYEEIWGK